MECWRKDGGVEGWMSSAWCGMMVMERNETGVEKFKWITGSEGTYLQKSLHFEV